MAHWLARTLFGTLLRACATTCLLVAVVHVLYFRVVPHLAGRRRRPWMRRYLAWVAATPSLLGEGIKIGTRHHLMRLAHLEGRHEQAAAQGFAILRHATLAPALAAEVRGRLADALDGLGRTGEAEAQRRLAVDDLKGADRTPSWYVNRGRQLNAQRDYAGACRAFELGLEAAPEGASHVRALLTLSLANALFMAGRVEESAHRAEEAAALVHGPEQRRLAHRLAAAAYGSLGQLEQAEPHYQRAVELARTLRDPARLADGLADLAELRRKRGRLAEALAACDEAAAVRTTRHVEGVRSEVLRSWGRFDEAFAANLRASQTNPLPTPRDEQKVQGVYAYGRAALRMEQGRVDEVPALLASAAAGLRGDPKLTVWVEGAATRLAALEGQRDDALRGLDRVAARQREFAQDRNTRATIFGNLGRAALALGEYDRAREFWQQYLDLPPTPVDRPVAYYHLGEAHRGLGDEAAARARYREAVATGLDTHYTRLAQSRLRSVLA